MRNEDDVTALPADRLLIGQWPEEAEEVASSPGWKGKWTCIIREREKEKIKRKLPMPTALLTQSSNGGV